MQGDGRIADRANGGGVNTSATGHGGVNLVIVYDKMRSFYLFNQRRALSQRLKARRLLFVFIALIIGLQVVNVVSISSLHTVRSHYPAISNAARSHTGHQSKSSSISKSPRLMTKEQLRQALSRDDQATEANTDNDTYARRRTADLPYVFSFLFGYLLFITYVLLKTRGPSRIRLTDEGLQFQWFGCLTSFTIPWSAINRVGTSDIHPSLVLRAFRKQFYHSKSIDLIIAGNGVPIMQRWLLRIIATMLPDGRWRDLFRAEPMLRLDTQAIVHDDDRRQLVKELERRVGADSIAPAVRELTDAEEEAPSFTKVWLDSLDAAGSARTLDPLKRDDVLAGGEYQIVDRIAAGGQALTYCARHNEVKSGDDKSILAVSSEQKGEAQLDDRSHRLHLPSEEEMVVLKEFILPERGGIKIRNRALANIEHEASLLRRIDHHQIVKLVDSFVQGHRAYLVMEKIDGQSLRQLVQQHGTFDNELVRALAMQMCEILNYLHEQKPPIIHRDFTPDNLLLKQNGELVLIDFNVAEQLEQECTKTVVGKHCYMPPEQFRGHPSPQSDIYAMGGTMFYLLTGEDPEPISISHPRATNSNVSEMLDAITAKATNPDTSGRYANALSLKSDLSAVVAV